ncbi:MAG: hypothetical protein GQ570_00955 [Helicobacteraceae bacterium]|nr:hypothetical protein [Helicobacteraceae bacterium]
MNKNTTRAQNNSLFKSNYEMNVVKKAFKIPNEKEVDLMEQLKSEWLKEHKVKDC